MAHAGTKQLEQDFDEGMLAEHVGFRVHIARRAIRRALRDSAPHSLPSGSISVLELIYRNAGIGPHALADILVLDRPKLSVLLRHLDAAGLIERIASTSDGRKTQLRLTEAGQRKLESSREFSEFQEQRIAKGLTAAERAQLNRLLRKLQETLA